MTYRLQGSGSGLRPFSWRCIIDGDGGVFGSGGGDGGGGGGGNGGVGVGNFGGGVGRFLSGSSLLCPGSNKVQIGAEIGKVVTTSDSQRLCLKDKYKAHNFCML